MLPYKLSTFPPIIPWKSEGVCLAPKVIHIFSTSYQQCVRPPKTWGYDHLVMLKDIVFHSNMWKTDLRMPIQGGRPNLSTFYAHADKRGVVGDCLGWSRRNTEHNNCSREGQVQNLQRAQGVSIM